PAQTRAHARFRPRPRPSLGCSQRPLSPASQLRMTLARKFAVSRIAPHMTRSAALGASLAFIVLPLACGGASETGGTTSPPPPEVDASIPPKADAGGGSVVDAAVPDHAAPPEPDGGKLVPGHTPIKHVVVVVKENHTF